MLPRQLYELLPFIYIITGIVCAMMIDSTVVLISSMLLIVAGVFVLLMRKSFRKSLNRNHELYHAAAGPYLEAGVERRSGNERRREPGVARWPIIDTDGDRVFSERRSGQRRLSAT